MVGGSLVADDVILQLHGLVVDAQHQIALADVEGDAQGPFKSSVGVSRPGSPRSALSRRPRVCVARGAAAPSARASFSCGRLLRLTPKRSTAAAEIDPVAVAADSAPFDDFLETDEERDDVALARATPEFVPASKVSAQIAELRRRDGE